jgi:hypothetical protein
MGFTDRERRSPKSTERHSPTQPPKTASSPTEAVKALKVGQGRSFSTSTTPTPPATGCAHPLAHPAHALTPTGRQPGAPPPHTAPPRSPPRVHSRRRGATVVRTVVHGRHPSPRFAPLGPRSKSSASEAITCSRVGTEARKPMPRRPEATVETRDSYTQTEGNVCATRLSRCAVPRLWLRRAACTSAQPAARSRACRAPCPTLAGARPLRSLSHSHPWSLAFLGNAGCGCGCMG